MGLQDSLNCITLFIQPTFAACLANGRFCLHVSNPSGQPTVRD